MMHCMYVTSLDHEGVFSSIEMQFTSLFFQFQTQGPP